MKVLHVYRTYYPDWPGGGQEAVRQICLATKPFGFENTIFTLSPNPRPSELQREEGVVIRHLSWWAPASCDLGGATAFTRFHRLVREADLIHYFFPWPFADLLHAAAAPQKPTVLTYLSDIVRQRVLAAAYAPLMWRTLRSVDAIVASSPTYARTSPVLSAPAVRHKVRVIALGSAQRSHLDGGDDSVLHRLGLGSEEPFVLFIGVLRYYKGLRTLVEAAPQIDARVVIAGSGPQGPSLERQARIGGARNVLFAGRVSEVEKAALLKRCRAVVLPSDLRSEAYSMVLVEAAMFGKPMVSCEIGTGTSYINVHDETGLVVGPGQPHELAQAVNTLLRDRELALRYGQAASERYRSMFSGETLGQGYTALYRELLGASRTA